MTDEMDLEITLPGSEEEPVEETEDQETEESESESEGEDSEEESSEEDDESEDDDPEKPKDEEDDEDKEKEKKPQDKQFRHSRPSYREIKEKFPEFFKTFPDLRDAFFREKEYSKVFPTVDDAREALAYAQSFGEISSELMQGNPTTLFSQLSEANPQAFKRVAENILPTIHRIDKETFFNITTPLLERFVRSMDEEGQRTNDANLRKAALIVGKFMTGELQIPDSSSKRREIDPERRNFEQEKTKFEQERFNTAQSDVFGTAESLLNAEIEKALENETDLTDFMRQKLSEEILKKVNDALRQDERHMALMNSLWRQWGKTNFSAIAKKRLVDAYITRAKQVVNPVRDRVMKEAMKRKTVKKVNRQEESETETSSAKPSKAITHKQVDWSKTSDKDFLNDKITLRK